MAFKIGNQTVIRDIDATAAIETNSDLDKLQINATDVLVHDGSTITLKNVEFDNSININTDDLTEGSTNLFHTTARVQAIIDTNTAGFITVDNDQQTLTFSNPNLSISNGNSVDLSALSTSLTGYATEIYVDTAEADAISTASADATNKANTAELNAKAYTDTRETAITTAYESYADQAEVDAKAYTDTRETAITTAYESYADQAEVDAKAYTDTRETAITTAYESYANAGDTATYNASKSYTDTEIASNIGSNLDLTSKTTSNLSEGTNLYYTDARVNTLLGTKNYATETYVDTAVANVVDSAPAALDTLNELAAALGDDPNLSTTLSTQIGTKVAKAGDTMTGALTLSGAPSSANHAATKAYVDASVSGGTGALDTDDIPEAGNLYYTDARVDARIPTTVSSFTNDSGYLTSVGTINYNDLSNKPTIPTNNNQLTNGAGYITSFTDTNTTYTAGNGLTLTSTEFKMSGSYTGSFTATGDVTAYSDERLKSNITTIEDALSKVKSMRGVMFDKTDSLSGDLRKSTGVIAQETEQVLPEVVHNDENTGYKSVAYGNIVGVLIEAIKEQQLQIDKLTEQVEFLKGKR